MASLQAGAMRRAGLCGARAVLQLHPDALRLAPAQRERRVPHAHHEGIAPGTGLGEDLDVLAAHEAELEQPPLERGERRRARADPTTRPRVPGDSAARLAKPGSRLRPAGAATASMVSEYE